LPLASLTHSITHFVAANGIYAVFGLMLVDAVFPAASELVMVYGGAIASGVIGGQHVVLFGSRIHDHTAAYLAIGTAGTLGYLVGSWAGWLIGARAGRPFVERHANAFHLDPDKLARADAWFRRYGTAAVLVGRITPVVRSFVSIPAGFERMPLTPYTGLTLAGSAVWSFALAGAGWAIGTGYQRFHHAFDYVSIAVVALALVAIALLAYRRHRGAQAEPRLDDA
jgi:membrane protein DedA with SNARE-associated domain